MSQITVNEDEGGGAAGQLSRIASLSVEFGRTDVGGEFFHLVAKGRIFEGDGQQQTISPSFFKSVIVVRGILAELITIRVLLAVITRKMQYDMFTPKFPVI